MGIGNTVVNPAGAHRDGLSVVRTMEPLEFQHQSPVKESMARWEHVTNYY